MTHTTKRSILVVAFVLLASKQAEATESIEFVAEHLPEIAMDNRYASLPLWSADPDRRYSFSLNAAYARTHSGTLSIDGPMISLGAVRTLGEKYRISGFVFFDDLTLAGGVERRPFDITFANPPLEMPADAEFTNLDGTARDVGFGFALNGLAELGWLPRFEWSAGVMWQRLQLSDYVFDYQILAGPDAGTVGTLDYSHTYTHISPFVGAAWPTLRGSWMFTPHFQLAMPLPRRGVVGRVTGPDFDLAGDASDNGRGKHFGDPSVTLGFNFTYVPWHLTVDLGSTVTQALIEPKIHEGVKHNVLLTGFWTF